MIVCHVERDLIELPAGGRSTHRVERMAWWRIAVLVPLVLGVLPGVGRAEEITWQEAVARLAAERTRAETCVRLLKRHASGDEAALSRGELAYSNAKADVDAAIAGLVVVLAQEQEPLSLSSLEDRLASGVQAREAFCAEVMKRVPDSEGTKNPIVQVLGEVLGSLIEAAVEIYKFESEEDRLLRMTIQTQLEATQWSDFPDIDA